MDNQEIEQIEADVTEIIAGQLMFYKSEVTRHRHVRYNSSIVVDIEGKFNIECDDWFESHNDPTVGDIIDMVIAEKVRKDAGS